MNPKDQVPYYTEIQTTPSKGLRFRGKEGALYSITSQLNHTLNSTTFQAECTLPDGHTDNVFLKYALLPLPACKPEQLDRYNRLTEEGYVLERLRRIPHTPRLIEMLEWPTAPALLHKLLITELYEGPNLDEAISQGQVSQWPLHRRILYARSIIETLALCHDHDVLHHDLKPANIIIPPNSPPKLTDFGTALRLDIHGEQIHRPVRHHTIAYTAPELLATAPHPSTTKTDIYALGLTLSELLLARITPSLPPKPSSIESELQQAGYDQKISSSIAQAINPYPHRRLQTIQELRQPFQSSDYLARLQQKLDQTQSTLTIYPTQDLETMCDQTYDTLNSEGVELLLNLIALAEKHIQTNHSIPEDQLRKFEESIKRLLIKKASQTVTPLYTTFIDIIALLASHKPKPLIAKPFAINTLLKISTKRGEWQPVHQLNPNHSYIAHSKRLTLC